MVHLVAVGQPVAIGTLDLDYRLKRLLKAGRETRKRNLALQGVRLGKRI